MANAHIDYHAQSIDSAFKDHYIVPDYQREYVWNDEQVEQLMADLLDAYTEDNKKPYFLGTIVTYKNGNQYELIDGQQRMTTFYILLCVIKNIYIANNGPASVIQKLLYSEVLNPNTGDAENKLHLQLQYEDAGNCLELIEAGAPRPKNLEMSGYRLFGAAKIISLFLAEKFPDMADLKKFVVFLLNQSSFVRIETYDINDALRIFETINQRGKGLDPVDLLKNLVFRQVDREKFKELNMIWKSVMTPLARIEEKPLRFLRYFIMANYDIKTERDEILREDQLYKWLSRNNDQCQYEEKPFQFVETMKRNVDLYVSYREPSDNKNGNIHLKNIPLLAGRSYKQHLMLMLAASNMDHAALAKFKGVLESVVYCTVVNKVPTNITERTFASWCKPIRSIVTVADLDAFIENTVKPTVDSWKVNNHDNFLRLGLSSMQQYRIKFILGKIFAYVEALRMGQTEADDLKTYIQSGVEIEHIMPQTCYDKAMYGVTDEDFPIMVDRLGNLTLLENSLNKSIHNDTYGNKCAAYKQSKFYLTSALPELIYQGKDTAINRTNQLLRAWPEWNRQSIESRQEMLYQLSEQIWSI